MPYKDKFWSNDTVMKATVLEDKQISGDCPLKGLLVLLLSLCS